MSEAQLLPPVLRLNRPSIETKSLAMGQALGVGDRGFDRLYEVVVDLLDRLDIPTGLMQIGVGDDRVDELARKASKDAAAATNPVDTSVPEIAAIIERALTETR